MKKLLIIMLAFCCLDRSLGQDQTTGFNLTARKAFRDHLDNLIYSLQLNGRLSNQTEAQEFQMLFASDATIYDYITPNYVSPNLGEEKEKKIVDFVNDVKRAFPNGLIQFSIVESNLGDRIPYETLDNNNPEIEVVIKIVAKGEYVEGGQFSNVATLQLKIGAIMNAGLPEYVLINSIKKQSSALMFLREEKKPFFEKLGTATFFAPWNNVQLQNFGGDYFIDNLNIDPGYGYSAGVQFIRLISAPEPEEFSFSFGLYYVQNNYTLTIDKYYISYLTTDTNNDQYFKNIFGENIREKVSTSFLEIPLKFRYERFIANRLGLYVQPGISLSYVLQTYFQGEGKFTYTGYYPRYDILLSEIEPFGFVSDVMQKNEQSTAINGVRPGNISFSGTLNIGLIYKLTPGVLLYLGGVGFKNIIEFEQKGSGHLISTQNGEYNGAFPVLNSINFGGFGFEVGVRRKFYSKNGIVKMSNKK